MFGKPGHRVCDVLERERPLCLPLPTPTPSPGHPPVVAAVQAGHCPRWVESAVQLAGALAAGQATGIVQEEARGADAARATGTCTLHSSALRQAEMRARPTLLETLLLRMEHHALRALAWMGRLQIWIGWKKQGRGRFGEPAGRCLGGACLAGARPRMPCQLLAAGWPQGRQHQPQNTGQPHIWARRSGRWTRPSIDCSRHPDWPRKGSAQRQPGLRGSPPAGKEAAPWERQGFNHRQGLGP